MGCTSIRLTTRSCSASTRRRRSKRWGGRSCHCRRDKDGPRDLDPEVLNDGVRRESSRSPESDPSLRKECWQHFAKPWPRRGATPAGPLDVATEVAAMARCAGQSLASANSNDAHVGANRDENATDENGAGQKRSRASTPQGAGIGCRSTATSHRQARRPGHLRVPPPPIASASPPPAPADDLEIHTQAFP